jgi:hypothetical protein
MSKGSRPRPYSVSQKQFGNNYDAIFRKENDMQVRVAEQGKKIGSCGCGRSPTGDCIGWHGLTEDAFKQKLAEYQSKQLDEATKGN